MSFSVPLRVSKPSVVPPVWPSTSRSRLATGRPPSRTASSRPRKRRSSLCSSPTSPFVRRTISPAEMETASSAVSSATVKRSATTAQMRTLATLKPIPTELLLVILPSVNCPTASARRMAPKFLENFAMLDPLDPTAKMFLKWS